MNLNESITSDASIGSFLRSSVGMSWAAPAGEYLNAGASVGARWYPRQQKTTYVGERKPYSCNS